MFYLNNSGSRWISNNPEDMKFALYQDGKFVKIRKAECFEAFGNFVLYVFKYKGKTKKSFPDAVMTHNDSGIDYPIVNI